MFNTSSGRYPHLSSVLRKCSGVLEELRTGLDEIRDGTLTRTTSNNFHAQDNLIFWSGFDDGGKPGVPSYTVLHRLTASLSKAFSPPEGPMQFWTDESLFGPVVKDDKAVADRCAKFLRYSMAQILG